MSYRQEIATPSKARQDEFIKVISALISKFHIDDADSIGIGFPGIMEKGIIISSTNLPQLAGLKLAQNISKIYNKPVAAANDADMALAGEMWLGLAKDKERAVMITLGSGVGGAISNSPNSELGHTVIDPGSVLECPNGHKGDIEALIGTLVTEKRFGQPISGLIQDLVFQKQYVAWLSKAIEILVNEHEPQIVVIGGGITAAFGQYFIHALPKFSVPVVRSTLAADAGIYGAAKTAMKGTIQ